MYEAVSKELPLSREAYVETLIGWDISPLIIDGQRVGAYMIKGHEGHIHVEPQFAKRYARRLIKNYLEPVIKEHGYLTTISFKEPIAKRFLERLGFYKTGEDENFYHYRIDATRIH